MIKYQIELRKCYVEKKYTLDELLFTKRHEIELKLKVD